MDRIKCAVAVLANFLLGAIFTGCGTYEYYFNEIGDNHPPYDLDKRIAAMEKYPQEIAIYLRPGHKENLGLNPELIVNRRYEMLYLHEVKYFTSRGKYGIFVKDQSFPIPLEWIERDGWYWRRGFGLSTTGKFFDEIENAWKYFPGPFDNRHFFLKIILTYSFDDGPIKTLEYEFEGKAWPRVLLSIPN